MFLEHHGVKGMRWGVRKEDGSNEHHKDNVLNYLYSKVGSMYESGDADNIWDVLDKVFERRVKIGELDPEQQEKDFDDWLENL